MELTKEEKIDILKDLSEKIGVEVLLEDTLCLCMNYILLFSLIFLPLEQGILTGPLSLFLYSVLNKML